MKVNILGTDYKIHFVDEFPEYLKEVGEGADGLWLNDPLKMVYCSIKPEWHSDLSGIHPRIFSAFQSFRLTSIFYTRKAPQRVPSI